MSAINSNINNRLRFRNRQRNNSRQNNLRRTSNLITNKQSSSTRNLQRRSTTRSRHTIRTRYLNHLNLTKIRNFGTNARSFKRMNNLIRDRAGPYNIRYNSRRIKISTPRLRQNRQGTRTSLKGRRNRRAPRGRLHMREHTTRRPSRRPTSTTRRQVSKFTRSNGGRQRSSHRSRKSRNRLRNVTGTFGRILIRRMLPSNKPVRSQVNGRTLGRRHNRRCRSRYNRGQTKTLSQRHLSTIKSIRPLAISFFLHRGLIP